MEFDITTIASPAAVAAVVWFFVRSYFEKQAEILGEVSKTLQDVQLKIAVHETKAGQVDKVLSDFDRIREEFTIEKSRIEAAWRMLDNLHETGKRQGHELDRIKNTLGHAA